MEDSISRGAYKKGFRHSFVMAVSTAIRIIFGFLPQIIIARQLGVGFTTDAYLMAISLNQIVIKFSRIGTLPKIFIMALSDDFVSDRKKINADINCIINALFIISLLFMSVLYCIAPAFTNLIARGFGPEKQNLTTGIFKILIPLFLYQCIIGLFEAIFKLFNAFSSWALLSIIPPAAIFIWVYLYTPKLGIYSIVYGTLVGSFIHVALLAYFVYFKFNYSYRPQLNLKNKLFPKMLKLLSPYYLSGIPVQIMLGVQSFLVSLLPAGFASIFFYARRIVDYIEQFSVNIFSQLMLPYFTKKIAQFSLAHIRKTYNQLIYLTNYTHLPILILIATFGRQLINILFTSKFTSPEIITKLGITFSAFILFYLPEPSNDVQSNVILSLKKTMWLNLVNISRMVITIFLSIVLFKYFAFWAIIFSYAISSLQGFIINQWYLRKQCAFENIFINPRFWKIIFFMP